MPVNTISPANDEYTFDEDYNVITNFCTFTFADGFQATTNKVLDFVLQPVTAVVCPPVDGSSSSSLDEESSPTTTTSFTYSFIYPFSESTIDAAATTPSYLTTEEESFTTSFPYSSLATTTSAAPTTSPYHTTQEESFTTSSPSPSSSSFSSSSAINLAATIPPYPTTPSNTSIAVLSPTIGASNTASGDIAPFTGDASSLRALCVVPMLGLVIGFWILG